MTDNNLTRIKIKNFTENGKQYQIKVSLKLFYISGNSVPYFSITADIYTGRNFKTLESCGCMPDEIAKHFPELETFLQWHLVGLDKPMHYIENSLYWFGFTENKYKDSHYYKTRKDAAKNTCLYGILRDDPNNFTLNDLYFDLIDTTDKDAKEYEVLKGYAETFLKNRLHSVMQKFDVAMIQIFGFTAYYRYACQFGTSFDARIDTFKNKHLFKQLEF